MTRVLKFDIRGFEIWHSRISNCLMLTTPKLWQSHHIPMTYTHFWKSNAKKKNPQNLVIASCYRTPSFFYIDYHTSLMLMNFSVKLISISSTDLLLFIKNKLSCTIRLSDPQIEIERSRISNRRVLTKPNLWQFHLFPMTDTLFWKSNAKKKFCKIWWLQVATEHPAFSILIIEPP